MNFFDTQERSHRNTRKLLLLMTLAVVAVVASVTAVIILAAWMMTSGNLGGISLAEWIRQRPLTPIAIASVTAVFIGLASLFRMAGLRQGGGRVARDLGGTLVSPSEQDPLRRRLRNVVEEMAIASGVPAPEIYVLEHESAINAFAAGFRPEDAAVAVTRGALETLNRDELQGVIAHEFSHVLNGDMRLNIRLMGPMFGIVVIGLLGRMLIRSGRLGGVRRRGSGNTMPAVALGAGLTAVGAIGLLLARLIKAGVSRQREYLADASAVQFTRQTEGLAGALKKIGGLTERSTLKHSTTEEISHMLFANGLRSITNWFATHPPLLERIQALDPAFSAKDYKQLHTEALEATYLKDSDVTIASLAASGAGAAQLEVTDPESVLRTIGNPDDRHYDQARGLHQRIPADIHEALQSHYQVMLLLPALMLHPVARNRKKQLVTIEKRLGAERRARIENLYTAIEQLGISTRLPLLDLALPLIKERPASQLEFMSELLEQLAAQNHYLELFEYALLRVFQSYVRRASEPAERRRWAGLEDTAIEAAAVTLLQVFAAHGHSDRAIARAALDSGLAALGSAGATAMPRKWAPACDAALETLLGCTPRDRQIVIRALIATAVHDGHISLAESELLRAFCAILECPLPPLLAAH